MTHRGPFQPRPFCDSVILGMQSEAVWDRAGAGSSGTQPLPALGFLLMISPAFWVLVGCGVLFLPSPSTHGGSFESGWGERGLKAVLDYIF